MQGNQSAVFEPFRLDFRDESLWRHNERLSLTPKAYAVLRYLVDHAGHLVRREMLFEAIWPDVYISDNALTVCIRELRQVLADPARSPRYIETVRGRGYRFVAPVTVSTPAPPRPSSGETRAPVRSAPSLMVARDRELAALHHQFEQMLQGQRQVVFISGEAGIGKTTLVDAFVSRVASTVPLWVGRGQCIDHYGAGEAYLPLLDALGQLVRGPEGQQFVSILSQQAPSWLWQIPALMSVLEPEALERRSRGATQARMLRELAETVETLAIVRPLVLVLEDLQWSDHATLDWLTFAAHRRAPAQLFILGTYRPADAIALEHPIHPIVHELQRQGRGEELPLDYLPAAGIQAYLDQRLGTSSLPTAFIHLLHQRTSGNPFFLVTMVDELIRQAVLVHSADGWHLQRDVGAMMGETPASIQRLIEAQLGVLAPEDRALLEAASVAGAEFSAAALGGVQAAEVEQIDTRCAALARQGRFVRAQGMVSWPDGTVAGGYQFIHALYQETLYHGIPVSRRTRLHQQIGARLEQAYGTEAHQIAAELAAHFVAGQDVKRAILYLQLAGEAALQRSAHSEAVGHLHQGLALLKSQPNTAARARQELSLQNALGLTYMAVRGYAAEEVEQVYLRARELSQEINDGVERARALMGLYAVFFVRANHDMADELTGELLHLAEDLQDSLILLQTYATSGESLLMQGKFAHARSRLEQGMSVSRPLRPESSAYFFGHDPGVQNLAALAGVLWVLGYPERAVERCDEAIALAQSLSHPFSLALALTYKVLLHQCRKEIDIVQESAETLVTLSIENGFPFRAALGRMLLGWTEVYEGDGQSGITQIQEAIAAFQRTGAKLNLPGRLGLLAEAYGQVGQYEQGLRVLEEAHAAVDSNGERYYESHLYRLQGDLLLQQVSDRPAKAMRCFQKAISIAQNQHAKSWELRAATRLAYLWQHQGKTSEAYDLLAPVYHWFTEGFATTDLIEAKALLDALS